MLDKNGEDLSKFNTNKPAFIPESVYKAPKKKPGRPKKVNAMGRKIEEPKVEEKPPEKTYEISITIGDTTVVGKGTTPLEALESIKTPDKITTKVFISITDGTRTKDIMYMPDKAKIMFRPTARYLYARNLGFLLK